jgi:dUTPase
MIEHGQRLAQGILEKLERCVLEEGTVDVTERGTGGFGSTGSK